jgi:tRNA (guanine-N7-)-methyltransferase
MKRVAEELEQAMTENSFVGVVGSDGDIRPRKKYFRSRAHCNPLSHNDSFDYPVSPAAMDWSEFYPGLSAEQRVPTSVDLGMGFGGLTVALAREFPDEVVLGLEIRPKVCEFVRLRIESLRRDSPDHHFRNASCLRTNGMRYLPCFIHGGQLRRLFICFPDPHFKSKNHRRRIVSGPLLSEYAYLLRPGGRLYLITDVQELHEWHVAKTAAHCMFKRIDDNEAMTEDPSVRIMNEETEEGKKVARLGGKKYWAVFERVAEGEEDREKCNMLALLSSSSSPSSSSSSSS